MLHLALHPFLGLERPMCLPGKECQRTDMQCWTCVLFLIISRAFLFLTPSRCCIGALQMLMHCASPDVIQLCSRLWAVKPLWLQP